MHGSKQNKAEHSDANRILVHLLYRSIQLSDLRRLTVATVFVHKLDGAVARRTVGVHSENAHGSTPPQENSDANGILVQPL